jgi:hypothetical protein
MFRRFRLALLAIILLVAAAPVQGSSAHVPAKHPLRPTEEGPPTDLANPFVKPPRTASDKQKQSAERVRLCGKEWRALKKERRDTGRTWKDFSRDCRERLKASGH